MRNHGDLKRLNYFFKTMLTNVWLSLNQQNQPKIFIKPKQLLNFTNPFKL